MNIRDELLKEHSRKQAMKIAAYVSTDEKRFTELMNLFLGNTYRVTQRAAWVVNICAEKNPSLILPWLPKMISMLEKDVHDAVKRNTLRTLQFIELPEKLYGRTADISFRLLLSPVEPIAVKVFAMTVLGNICKHEPDLKNELRIVIEEQLENSSAGFRARANNILKQIAQK